MKKILVIRLGAIGDVLLASPALLNLKLSFPEAEIYFLTRADLSRLAEYFAGCDKILPFPKRASARDLFRMGEYLDKQKFDTIIDLHRNIRSRYLMKHVSAPRKIGYFKRTWGRLKAVKFNKLDSSPPHTIDLYNDAVRKIGGKIYAKRPVINLPYNRPRQLVFNNDQKTIVISPGASYPTKQWPLEKFGQLAISLQKEIGCNIVFALTHSDSELGNITDKIQSENVRLYVDASLEKLASVFSESDLIICNDSAMAHLGSSVGTRVLSIFGPTHPTLGFAPRGLRDSVMQVDEYCRPCSKHGKKPCFREEQFCFTRITVEKIFEKVKEILPDQTDEAKALFIDRDGTLIKEKHFLKDLSEVELETDAVAALKLAKKAGYKVIVISNQSGVARGYFDEATVVSINKRVQDIFAQKGVNIDEFLYCPHLSGGKVERYNIECSCRKPAPGMIETAAMRHNINPSRSFVIGDKLADVNLGFVTGSKSILVRTGYGKEQEKILGSGLTPRPEKVLQNLFEGVKYITGELDRADYDY